MQQHEIQLSGVVYKLPPLDMAVVCRLATLGVDLLDTGSRSSALRTLIGFIALGTKTDDLQQASSLLEKHLSEGGDLQVLVDGLTAYVGDSPLIRNSNANQGKGGIRWPIAKRHGRGKKKHR